MQGVILTTQQRVSELEAANAVLALERERLQAELDKTDTGQELLQLQREKSALATQVHSLQGQVRELTLALARDQEKLGRVQAELGRVKAGTANAPESATQQGEKVVVSGNLSIVDNPLEAPDVFREWEKATRGSAVEQEGVDDESAPLMGPSSLKVADLPRTRELERARLDILKHFGCEVDEK